MTSSSIGCVSALALTLVGVVPTACGGGQLGGTNITEDPAKHIVDPYPGYLSWPATLHRKLDVLFVVDDSAGMDAQQQMLRAALPTFFDVLSLAPGGLPDLHVAVVTSDYAVGNSDIPGCRELLDGSAVFRSGVGALSDCVSTGLEPGAAFLTTTGGASPVTNFTGNIASVLQCITPVGTTGCGFEQPLRSMVRSLGADGFLAPSDNQRFIRADAALAIVLLSNEDDCSALSPSLYDVNGAVNLASTLGPPGNFRCAEFGHVCNGRPPARRAPNGRVGDTVDYENCEPAEDAGQLLSVWLVADALKKLKPEPWTSIVVATIQGPVAPYRVHWRSPAIPEDGPWPEITHSCASADGSVLADPGVRLQSFNRQFGGNGLVFSICEPSFTPALDAVARAAGRAMGSACVAGPVADCSVIDRVVRDDGRAEDTVVPACAASQIAPCWRAEAAPADGICPDGSSTLVIDRGGAPVAPGQVVFAKCAP